MVQNTPQKASKKQTINIDELVNSIKLFFEKMPDNDKIAYGLILLGVIFVIIGLILW